jgi:hypothetical protein
MRHILNRVYLTTDQLHLRDQKQLRDYKIGLVMTTDRMTIPTVTDGIDYERVAVAQSRDDFDTTTATIRQMVESGRAVLIDAENENSPSFLMAIAYLMDAVGMTFPNAYMRMVVAYSMLNVDLSVLLAAYNLPYHQSRDLHGNLIALSRSAVSPISDQLFISGIEALENPDKARGAGIHAVLRLDRGSERAALQWPSHYKLLDIPIHDGTLIPSEILRQGSAFIHRHIKAGDKVLVHCMMGMSRSVTVVLAYLVEYAGMSLADAYALVVKVRPIAQPHPALLQSLVQTYNLSVGDVWNVNFLDRLLTAANPLTLRR